MLPIRTILHPTNFSERSEYALLAAHSLARDHGARLVILYVRAPVVVAVASDPIVPDPIRSPADVRDRLSARHVLDPRVEVEYRVGDGDPASAIIRVASQLKANLIVMGTHGRTGLGRLLMGSVAEAVLRRAPCAVLTLKAPFFVGAEKPETRAGELAPV